MSFENPFKNSNPQEAYAEADKKVAGEEVSLEHERGRRDRRTGEFVDAVWESPTSILQIIDLLPVNLDVFLAKRRLSYARSERDAVLDETHAGALEINAEYDRLKGDVVAAEVGFKGALEKLAAFEAENLR